MRRLVVVPLLFGLVAPTPIWAQGVWPACQVRTRCAGVAPGGGRVMDCLRDHKRELSEACLVALGHWMINARSHGAKAASTPAPAASPATATVPTATDQGPDPADVNMAPVPKADEAAPPPQ